MSGSQIRIAIAQINPLVGDIEGNTNLIIRLAAQAREELNADVVIFPELTLSGYPPEDLLLRQDLYLRVNKGLREIMRSVSGIDVLVGYPHQEREDIFNACVLIRDGRIAARYFKRNLPNYGVFDEKRYFREGHEPCVVKIGNVVCGLSICEDIWLPRPAREAVTAGAQVLLNLNASPYHVGKDNEREMVVVARARENRVPIVYINQSGGQDELVFDGASFIIAADGTLLFQAPAFEEGLYLAEIRTNIMGKGEKGSIIQAPPNPTAPRLSPEESIYSALVLGVRDYTLKNGFSGVVVGLSGGVDSALVLAIAADALGPDRVEAISMPSRYTADMSMEDAETETNTLGIKLHTISIEPLFTAFLNALSPLFSGTGHDTTEENLQARCRGIILMAISNKNGRMVLTTGNKSEMAVGYATLYGDMAGGFAPLKDVPKMSVYRLAKWRNRHTTVIPQRVIERPPSAELSPDQKDEDSLPPYSVLDAILELYVEQDRCLEEIAAMGFDPDAVNKVVSLVDRNEYKRRQAAPGVRITKRAFGRDRRYPITTGFGKYRHPLDTH
ncbi:MAG: NAD+ synthase [Gammaproteobacteria bacterium]|nr:NAD+ synthase [Gammaproteobacteria bacterium]